MRKKVFLVSLVFFILSATSYAGVSVGIRLPFQMSRSITAKTETNSKTSSEMWIGGLGTIEYNFSPIFGVELGAGYLMSLGGKSINEWNGRDEWEYKNEIIPISMLMKVYIPIGKRDSSSISVYFAGGPQIAIVTRKQKTDDEYKKTYTLTNMGLGGLMGLVNVPTLKMGIDYCISKAVKLGSLIEVGFSNESYDPKEVSSTDSHIGFGLGLGLKYCF